DLILARREMRVRLRRSLLVAAADDAEHADDPVALVERTRADLDLDALAILADHDHRGLGRRPRPHHLAQEGLLGLARLLRDDERRLLPSADVADETLRGGIDPADDPEPVDRVGRDVQILEAAMEIARDTAEVRCASCGLPGGGHRVTRRRLRPAASAPPGASGCPRPRARS